MSQNINEYLHEHKLKAHSKETVRTYRGVLNLYKHLPIKEWLNHYYERSLDLSPFTAHRELGRLKTFSRWCFEKKYIKKDYLENALKPKLPKCLPKSLPARIADRILAGSCIVSPRAKAIFHTFLYTGLRCSELCKLTPEQVRLDEEYIAVIGGKGGKDRLIPISYKLKLILEEWSKARPKHRYYFCASPATLRRDRYKVQAKIGHKFGSHQLRHTFATQSLANGVDLFSLKELMGHESIAVTQRYLSASVGHMKGQIDKLSF